MRVAFVISLAWHEHHVQVIALETPLAQKIARLLRPCLRTSCMSRDESWQGRRWLNEPKKEIEAQANVESDKADLQMWKLRRCRWSKVQHIHLISITESQFISVSTKNSTDSNSGSDRNVNNVTPTSFLPWHFLIASHTQVNAMHSRATIMRRACVKMLLAHVCLPTQKSKITILQQFLMFNVHFAQRTSQYYFVLQSLHKVRPSTTSYYKACTKYPPPSTTSYYKACTKYVPVLLRTTKLAHSNSQYYFVLQSLHKVRPSTTSYYKAPTKYVPVLLRTKMLAQSTSQYYFVLQSLRKVRPSTTSYYKACTKYVPVLLRTTKLAQSTSQYYFVLQSLHKVRPRSTSHYKACTKYVPGTTSYYKACTKYFPVLLRTTKLAQSTSQYYFVLQKSHKVLPSTTSYYKACTKYFPVLLRTTKLAQSTSQYYFVLQSLHKVRPSTTSYYKACTSTSQYYFVLQSSHKVRPSTTSYYKACTKYVKIVILLEILTIEHHFVRKGCAGPLKIAIWP